MNNFKKNKPHQPHRLSTDGFLAGDGNNKPANIGSINFDRKAQNSGGNATIDDFSRPDGFHPVSQTVVSNSAATGTALAGDAKSSLPLENKLNHTALNTKPHRWRKIILTTIACIVIVALLVIGFLFVKGDIKPRKIFQQTMIYITG